MAGFPIEEAFVAPGNGDRQGDHFGDAQAGGVEHLDEGMQPHCRGVCAACFVRGKVEKARYLGLRKHLGQGAGLFR